MKPAKLPALPLRLMLARSLAWAVHTSGWLVLGAVGARLAPLWLGLQAYALQACAGLAPTAGRVRAAWLLAALLLLTAVAAASPWLLAAAWAAASVAASWTVRLLRGPQRSPLHQALLPAALGVAAAGCFSLPALLGVPDWAGLLPGVTEVLALTAVALGAALTRACGPARHACRGGVLDEWRALQGLDAGAWRAAWVRRDLPQRLAAVAMLPMMAGLPALLALCTPAGASAPQVVGAHLAAMVLPGVGLAWALRPRVQHVPALCAALLIAGGLALPWLPLLQGLMGATLLHTAAWSVAWAAGLQSAGAVAVSRSGRLAAAPSLAALAAAAGVLAVGLAVSGLGPRALWLAHAALAALAVVWVLAGAVAATRQQARPPAQAHPAHR